MKRFIHLHAGVAALFLAFTLSACDTTGFQDDNAGDSESPLASVATSEMATLLSAELSLSSDDSSDVADALTRYDWRRKPGQLWFVAKRMQAGLPDSVKERLFALTEKFEDRDIFGLVCFVGPGGLTGPDWLHRPAFANALHLLRMLGDQLTEEQRAQFRELLAEYHAAVRELIAAVRAGEMTREEFHAALGEVQAKFLEAGRSILTDDQIAAIEERIAARIALFEEFVKASKAAMYEALEANGEQIAAMESLCERLSLEKDALFEQFSSQAMSREELRAALNALNAIEAEELATILNDVQYEIVLIHKALLLRARRIAMGHHRDAPGIGTDRRNQDRFYEDPGGSIFGFQEMRGINDRG